MCGTPQLLGLLDGETGNAACASRILTSLICKRGRGFGIAEKVATLAREPRRCSRPQVLLLDTGSSRRVIGLPLRKIIRLGDHRQPGSPQKPCIAPQRSPGHARTLPRLRANRVASLAPHKVS